MWRYAGALHTRVRRSGNHSVCTAVETLRISRNVEQSHCVIFQNTQTPPGDSSQPTTVLKVKGFDFAPHTTSLLVQLKLFLELNQ